MFSHKSRCHTRAEHGILFPQRGVVLGASLQEQIPESPGAIHRPWSSIPAPCHAPCSCTCWGRWDRKDLGSEALDPPESLDGPSRSPSCSGHIPVIHCSPLSAGLPSVPFPPVPVLWQRKGDAGKQQRLREHSPGSVLPAAAAWQRLPVLGSGAQRRRHSPEQGRGDEPELLSLVCRNLGKRSLFFGCPNGTQRCLAWAAVSKSLIFIYSMVSCCGRPRRRMGRGRSSRSLRERFQPGAGVREALSESLMIYELSRAGQRSLCASHRAW